LIEQGYGNPITWLEKLRREGAAYLAISDKRAFFDQRNFCDHVMQNYLPLRVRGDGSFLLFNLRDKRT
jgi:hypothetical protein